MWSYLMMAYLLAEQNVKPFYSHSSRTYFRNCNKILTDRRPASIITHEDTSRQKTTTIPYKTIFSVHFLSHF